jgi:uncharacterized protein YjbI with pentapeptide repeats
MKRIRKYFAKYKAWIAAALVLLLGWMAYLRFGRGLGWVGWTGFAGETLLDWLELLIIPIFIAVGAWWLDRRQKETEREFEQARLDKDREIAREKRQDVTLEAYFDRMTALLLEEGLRDSEEGDEVRKIARTRTRVVLRRMDGKRNGHVVRFLSEAGLMLSGSQLVSLEGIDLQGSDLEKVNLAKVNFQKSNLREAKMWKANLEGADLWRADLSGARLFDADLNSADLQHANLQEAFLMDASLQCVNLMCGDLRGANLQGTDLQGANLSDSDLRGSELLGTDLRETDLLYTDLRRSDLSGVRNLDKADFEGAKMKGAKVLAGDVETLERAGVDVEVLEVVE